MRRAPLAAGLVVLGLAGAPPPPVQAQETVCTGEVSAANVAQRAGPALRFGVTPSGEAGQVGPLPASFVPDRPPRILEALGRLRKPGVPFVTHSYSSWKDAGAAEDRRLLGLASRYTEAGYEWELVLRYRPRPERDGDVAGYADWVRHVVRLLGRNPRVVAFQITNEVNFTASPDSSDGAFANARDALIQGVIAARTEADRIGARHLQVGFNWLYRMDTASERTFWEHLRDRGGASFVRALSWVGLDAYPGTFFPPSAAPGTERDFVVNALDLLRRCYLPIARIPHSTPIHVQENGFPTGSGRTYERQQDALVTMVRAFHDFRGTFNVSDYRWFNLRDAETSSPNFQQQYGLMTDAYQPKPAFGSYAALVRALAGDPPSAAGARPRPRLALRLVAPTVRRRGSRCAPGPVRASVSGADRRAVSRIDFHLNGTRKVRDRRLPFAASIRLSRHTRPRMQRIKARVFMRDGRRLSLVRRVRSCGTR
jgi:hypothetical protein